MGEYSLEESIRSWKIRILEEPNPSNLLSVWEDVIDRIKDKNSNVSTDVLVEAYGLSFVLKEKTLYFEAGFIQLCIARQPNAPKDILAELICSPDAEISRAAKQNPQMQSYLPFE